MAWQAYQASQATTAGYGGVTGVTYQGATQLSTPGVTTFAPTAITGSGITSSATSGVSYSMAPTGITTSATTYPLGTPAVQNYARSVTPVRGGVTEIDKVNAFGQVYERDFVQNRGGVTEIDKVNAFGQVYERDFDQNRGVGMLPGQTALVPGQSAYTGFQFYATPPQATVGVDLNHNGRADMYVSGVDMNRDGIPDALEPKAMVGLDLNHNGRADMYVAGVDLNRDGIPDCLETPVSPVGMLSPTMSVPHMSSSASGFGSLPATSQNLVNSGVQSRPQSMGSVPTQHGLEVPYSTVGVDLNHDGRANMYVSGVDMNRDGIPDALQKQASIGLDINGDGRSNTIITGVDADNDGIPDVLEQKRPSTMTAAILQPGMKCTIMGLDQPSGCPPINNKICKLIEFKREKWVVEMCDGSGKARVPAKGLLPYSNAPKH